MKRTIDTTSVVGVVTIAFFLVVALALGQLNIRRVHDHGTWSMHSHLVERTVTATLGLALDARSNVLAHLLNGSGPSLQQYHRARREWPVRIADLRRLVSDNAAQVRRVAALDSAAISLFLLMDQRIASRQALGTAMLDRPLPPEGDQRMAALRRVVDAMLAEEARLSVQRDADYQEAYRTARWSNVLSALIGLLLLAGFTLVLFRGIRAQRNALRRAYEQEQWFRTTLASIGDAVIATDAEGRITFMNAVAAQLMAVDKETCLGRPLREVFRIVNEHTRLPVEDPVEKVLRHGRIVGLANHTVLLAQDGTERPIDDSAAPIRTMDGSLVGVVMVFHDVSQQRADARNLERSEARKSAILDNALDCIISIDRKGRIIEFNPAAERTFGHRANEVIGQDMAALIVPEAYREAHRKGFAHYLNTGEGPVLGRRFEIAALRFDGTEFPVELAITPISDPVEPTFTAHLRDITDRKRLEQELRQTAADLSEADRRKSEFLAILAHELRNPLAPVRNALEVIKISGDDPHALHRSTEMMERQVAHMVRLIDDLLDVTRISRGKIELRPEPVALDELVQQAVDGMRNAFEARKQHVDIAIAGRPIHLFADPVRIAQVVGNLLNNACKFTHPGGRIAIRVQREGRTAVVSVQDNGIGIAPEQLPRIFTLFTQVDPSLERTQGGLGIGLTLVKWLVELHNGTIDVRSDGLGKGTTFSVRLPVLKTGAAASDDRGTVHVRPLHQRILVVDDNQDAADSLAYLLRANGHTVFVAHDGEAAITAAQRHMPDVLLLDIGLPRLNGYEAARRVRALPGMEKSFLIALTGWGQDDDRRRAKEAGFDAHLVKPVDLERLLRVMGTPRH